MENLGEIVNHFGKLLKKNPSPLLLAFWLCQVNNNVLILIILLSFIVGHLQ